ncbi:diguanylate cyclase with chase2 sensor [Leptolyngbya sp. Heron Island J]|uniref:CHASE2 domain-containing protein n=1 Tax=Leptolyngbya sp. Heron Island J TaxID=1385935 RepID=UPI0003B983E6|nr:CHASE2 domain-containing protein [Leptolyngbya sp. Heron Island J]ESA37606.1 diguanylate cyclase with chase2 sensor [Leptolyngbya sp. Heron Island J]
MWASLVTASSVLALRSLGCLQMIELRAFDKMLGLRVPESPDPRIVIVGITDADLDSYLGTASVSDQIMVELIRKVQSQQPRVIGLDFYRSLPNEPGTKELTEVFANTSKLIGIEKVIGGETGDSIPGNTVLKATDQIAASDIVVDADGRIRRGVLFPTAHGSNVVESLGLRLALDYLAEDPYNITPDLDAPVLTLNNVVFPPIESHTGGYVETDAQGYQILLHLRQQANPFDVVSLKQVLRNEIPSDLMRDRIVLIGSMALSSADIFYAAGRYSKQQLPIKFGVELHGEVASQIISTTLDGRPLLHAWPQWIESLLVIGTSAYGSYLVQKATKLWQRLTLIPGVSLLVFGSSYVALNFAGLWLPVVPALLGLWIAAGLIGAHRTTQLQVLSTNDKLTGLANRRTFDESLQQTWFKALRSQQPLALIVGDVDHFKKYNDTYGHPQGDECLRRVAQAIRTTVKTNGALNARYGGEEFVVLLPNTSATQGIAIATAILTKLATYHLPHAASDTAEYVTMSLGVTSFIPKLEIPPSALVEMADLGLYTAKKSGRNCVRLHQPNTLNSLSLKLNRQSIDLSEPSEQST